MVGVALEVAHVPPFFLEPKKRFATDFIISHPWGFLQGLLLKGFYGGCFAAGVRMRYFLAICNGAKVEDSKN